MLSHCISLQGHSLDGSYSWAVQVDSPVSSLHTTFSKKASPLLSVILPEGLQDPLKAENPSLVHNCRQSGTKKSAPTYIPPLPPYLHLYIHNHSHCPLLPTASGPVCAQRLQRAAQHLEALM